MLCPAPLALAADGWADLRLVEPVALAGVLAASRAAGLVLVPGASADSWSLSLALLLVAFACVGFGFVFWICFVAIGKTSIWVLRKPRGGLERADIGNRGDPVQLARCVSHALNSGYTDELGIKNRTVIGPGNATLESGRAVAS